MSEFLISLGNADFWIGVGVVAGIYAILGLGLQLNVGFTGLLNFGQAGFMAVGAYTMAILVATMNWPLWAALVVAIVAAVGAGVIIGLPALRLRAEYFGIATIAFAEIIRHIAQNAHNLTGGNQGLFGYDTTWTTASLWIQDRLGRVGLATQYQLPLLLVTWGTFALLALLLVWLQRAPWGRVLRSIREDEDAATALGKNVFSYKLQSIGVASAIGAVAGFLSAMNLTVVHPSEFDPMVTFIGYGVLILGGFATYVGVAVGSIILWILLEAARFLPLPLTAEKLASIRFIIVGAVLMAFVAFRPHGVLGKRQEMVLRD